MKALTLAALLVLSTNVMAHEHFPDVTVGNGLLSLCESEPGYAAGLCMGYIMGARYGFEDGARVGSAPWELRFCIPEGVTYGQMVDVVVAYIEANPATRHKDSMVHTLTAFRKAWPCKGVQ